MKIKETILTLCLILMCLTIISSVSAVDDTNSLDVVNTVDDVKAEDDNNILLDDNNGTFCNMTNPFSQSTGTPAIPDENNCFEMTTRSNAGTPYYWEVDTNATCGVDVTNTYSDYFYPEGYTGGELTNHFVFHITNNEKYFVKLNLIDCRTGEIVQSVNSNMVN